MLWPGPGDSGAVCTELSLSHRASGDPEEAQAQGTRVLKAISHACPNALPCAGAVLDHLKCVLVPDMGHAPSFHLPVLFLLTLHLFKGIIFSGDM